MDRAGMAKYVIIDWTGALPVNDDAMTFQLTYLHVLNGTSGSYM
jgi:hypothetical protein